MNVQTLRFTPFKHCIQNIVSILNPILILILTRMNEGGKLMSTYVHGYLSEMFSPISQLMYETSRNV